jgi:hypothetical protein
MALDIEMKKQRIRDPVHGLISFSSSSDFEQLIWRLLNAAEFQRLRRIKQLGFSELVYPGATHTRFSHSVGVFHTARELVRVLCPLLGDEFLPERAEVAVCGALLHDLGHGPFSHTFESALKSLGPKKKHEKWTTEIIRGDTEINQILHDHDPELLNSVATLLEEEHPADIYSSIVSSQFDADRLDYLRRDKMMTGTEQGGFDWAWILNNLEIEKLAISGAGDEDFFEVDGLILGSKGLQAAESYLLGRFHLYTQVYMHKTTRAAEKMLGALLERVARLVSSGTSEKTGLVPNHPIARYFEEGNQTLENYLDLDDATIWGCLPQLELANDKVVAELAHRLRRRNLYKCLDIGAKAETIGGNSSGRFGKRLQEARGDGRFGDVDVLEDRAQISAYESHEYESQDALSKIMIRRSDGTNRHEDVEKLSDVVKALGTRKIFRVYARDQDVMNELGQIWKEAEG